MKLAEITLAPLSQALGTTVDGVLGNDILQNLTFKLSYSKQQLCFYAWNVRLRHGYELDESRVENVGACETDLDSKGDY